ncbi:MAG: hemerythrin protein [Segetibacter sp.]|nr:hemerythrin protein [Segetibacter sp.]
MENKPIKRSEHIVQLSKEHHSTLLFCWKIRNGLKFSVEFERINNYVQYFWQHHMLPHFVQEQSILFAPVIDEAVQRALNEHAQIASQIQDLEATTNKEPHQLSNLADLVDNHVRYEERVLFPHLEKVLSGEQLEKIGMQIAAQHDPTLKDNFSDAFWLRKIDPV